MSTNLADQSNADTEKQRKLAESVREAVLRAALEGYEQAGLAGMCDEGRWEMAVDSMRSLNLDALVEKAKGKE